MNETKHTPGPWYINWTRLSGNVIGFHIADAVRGSTLPICEHYGNPTLNSSNEAEANARLIAAAPELLAVLQEIMSWEENDEMTWGPRARAAIAEATREPA